LRNEQKKEAGRESALTNCWGDGNQGPRRSQPRKDFAHWPTGKLEKKKKKSDGVRTFAGTGPGAKPPGAVAATNKEKRNHRCCWGSETTGKTPPTQKTDPRRRRERKRKKGGGENGTSSPQIKRDQDKNPAMRASKGGSYRSKKIKGGRHADFVSRAKEKENRTRTSKTQQNSKGQPWKKNGGGDHSGTKRIGRGHLGRPNKLSRGKGKKNDEGRAKCPLPPRAEGEKQKGEGMARPKRLPFAKKEGPHTVRHAKGPRGIVEEKQRGGILAGLRRGKNLRRKFPLS